MTETVQRNSIVIAPIELTRSNWLTNNIKSKLQKIYDDVEFI